MTPFAIQIGDSLQQGLDAYGNQSRPAFSNPS